MATQIIEYNILNVFIFLKYLKTNIIIKNYLKTKRGIQPKLNTSFIPKAVNYEN